MVAENTMHLLKLSGFIPVNKEKEFEQTVRFVFNQLSQDCVEKVLSLDMSKKEYYHIFSLWTNEYAVKKFMVSVEYQLIIGAFEALGTLEKTVFGTCAEKQSFQSGNLN